MKKIELLSPVGDFECLKAAVQNGADSVYFGASSFNARASATNFDLTDLKNAIEYAKLRGVNTHLTLNTLIKNNEFEDAVILAKKAYEFGIDAIIVQDLGLAKFLIKNFPDLPIHASTQMTIHNLAGAIEAQNLGFKRVVLSRELSLEEIQYICSNVDIEIETFIHGALCISYSGQCLFSSMIGGRSGNRGRCAQPCRLPYELIKKDTNESFSTPKILDKGYLLSTKDLCALDFLPSLIEAGVMCFKIEGRMKTPEYVATVTRIYRKYINLALSSKPYIIDENDKKELQQVFNRGGFSCGHLSNESNKNLVYKSKQNNMGIYIGNVSNLSTSKGHILFNLTDCLSIGDTIQFEKENTKYTVSELIINGKNTPNASKKQLIEIGRMKGNIHIGDKIFKIASKELSSTAKSSYQNENKKIKLSAIINVKENEPITLNIFTLEKKNLLFKNISIDLSSEIIPIRAISNPINSQRIINQLSKTSDTIFEFENITVNLGDNLFIPSISKLNELRRIALNEILAIAKNKLLRKSIKLDTFTNILKQKSNNITVSNRKISLLLNNINIEENYYNLRKVDNVYIPLKFFANKKYEASISTIANKYPTYIYLPSIIKTNYKNILQNVIENSIDRYHIKGFVISNISSGLFVKEMQEKYNDRFEFISNYTLNIYNNYTMQELFDLGIHKFTISPELDKQTIFNICNSLNCDNELIVYGNIPLMSMNYCLLGSTNKCYPTCGAHCKEENSKYYLKDRMGLNFRLLPDNIQTVTTLYNSKITSIIGSDFNVSSYRIDIIDESVSQINQIIDTVLSGSRFDGIEYTNGNLNREV